MKHLSNERELIKSGVRAKLQTVTVITEAITLHPSCVLPHFTTTGAPLENSQIRTH